MSSSANALAAKDIAYVLHPYTDLVAHEERGPLIITHGEGGVCRSGSTKSA
jgi:4-aminobutyrate--pyruvate transaminase